MIVRKLLRLAVVVAQAAAPHLAPTLPTERPYDMPSVETARGQVDVVALDPDRLYVAILVERHDGLTVHRTVGWLRPLYGRHGIPGDRRYWRFENGVGASYLGDTTPVGRFWPRADWWHYESASDERSGVKPNLMHAARALVEGQP